MSTASDGHNTLWWLVSYYNGYTSLKDGLYDQWIFNSDVPFVWQALNKMCTLWYVLLSFFIVVVAVAAVVVTLPVDGGRWKCDCQLLRQIRIFTLCETVFYECRVCSDETFHLRRLFFFSGVYGGKECHQSSVSRFNPRKWQKKQIREKLLMRAPLRALLFDFSLSFSIQWPHIPTYLLKRSSWRIIFRLSFNQKRRGNNWQYNMYNWS